MRRTVGWQRAADALLPLAPHRDVRIDVEDVTAFLRSDADVAATAELLGGPDFTLRQLQDRAADPGFERQVGLNKRKRLHAEMLRAADPAAVNQQLNELECGLGCDELLSFPTFVGLNMTSVCNARCVFCSYQPSMLKERDRIGVEDLKKMTWLRYVKDFAIWGGIGDSLVNPEFLDCYRYLKAAHPHLAVTFSTNGIRMTRELCEEFAGHLSQYNVSLNAARKETWETLMRAKGFDNVCETFAYLARRRRELGAEKPRMTLSMVLTRANVEEAVEFVELAARLGADAATFVHYVSTTLVGRRDLAPEDSLYYERRRRTIGWRRRRPAGAELGVQVARPLPFAAESAHVQYGARVAMRPAALRRSVEDVLPDRGRRGAATDDLLLLRLLLRREVRQERHDGGELPHAVEPSRGPLFPPHGEQAGRQSDLRLLSIGRPLRSGKQRAATTRSAPRWRRCSSRWTGNVVFFRLPAEEPPKEPQPCRQGTIPESSSSAT